VHSEYVRSFFMDLYNNGYVLDRDAVLPYCPRDGIFLPDRFVVGTCPYCGYELARGDQCENCGRLLEPRQLVKPRCAVCGSNPEWRVTRHWYLDLRKVEDKVRAYVEGNEALPETARQMSLGMLREGLRPRAITRDNKWGIEAPFPGSEGKTIYVWFEALLGYVSATIEYLRDRGDEWARYWFSQDTRVVFFVGKDNIPFHVVILPAMFIASGKNYVMPYTTASTEYLLYEGRKFSKSQRVGIWIDEAPALMPVDYWRFILIYTRPETRDTSFTWMQAVDIVNSILNDTVGNFIHRVLTFTASRFNHEVPGGEHREVDDEYWGRALDHFKRATEYYEDIRLREALMEVVEIARVGNRYLNERQPWELIRRSREEAGGVINNALRMVTTISMGLTPVMPRIMGRLWGILNISPGWFDATKPLDVGHRLGKPEPLFRKITEEDLANMQRKLEEIRKIKDSRKYPWEQVWFPQTQ
jgi:methionyl-tRNA synthetase